MKYLFQPIFSFQRALKLNFFEPDNYMCSKLILFFIGKENYLLIADLLILKVLSCMVQQLAQSPKILIIQIKEVKPSMNHWTQYKQSFGQLDLAKRRIYLF